MTQSEIGYFEISGLPAKIATRNIVVYRRLGEQNMGVYRIFWGCADSKNLIRMFRISI